MSRGGPNPNTGQHTPPHAPPFNGTTTQTEGVHHTQDGEANNTATLPSPCHPPSAIPSHHPRWPHPPPRRGGSGRRIPHHTNSTDTHSPPTPQDLARSSARHDSSTRQHRNGMSRARVTPLHWAGQQQHTRRHSTHRGRWTPSTHPLIHSSTLTHRVHTTNEQQ